MAPMIRAASFVILVGGVFAGCTATKKAAVSTFHVIDAPQTTTTTTVSSSDVTTPGYAVANSTPQPQVAPQHRSTTTTTLPSPSEGPRKVTPGATAHTAAQ